MSVVRRDQSFRFDRLKKKEYVVLAQDVLSFMKLAFSICRMKLRGRCASKDGVEVTQRQVGEFVIQDAECLKIGLNIFNAAECNPKRCGAIVKN